jgi:hypothetical protein
MPCEEARIKLRPAVGRLLKEEVGIETEARMLADYSLPRRPYREVVTEIEELLRNIRTMLGGIKDQKFRKTVRRILADIWSDEMEIEPNIAMAVLFAENKFPEAMDAAEIMRRTERNYLQALLKIKRFSNRLPEGYSFSHMDQIDYMINQIDASVFGFEEKIQQIKTTEDSWESR